MDSKKPSRRKFLASGAAVAGAAAAAARSSSGQTPGLVPTPTSEAGKKAIEIAAGIALLPAPTLRREVEARTLVAVPLYGCRFVRPLGIIQHRHHRLGSSAQRFLDLLLEPSQDSSSPGSASAGAAKPAKPRTRGNGAPHGRNGAAKAKLKETK